MDQTPMTPRGEDLLRKELQRLKTVERPRIVAQLPRLEAMVILAKTQSTMQQKKSRAFAKQELKTSKAS